MPDAILRSAIFRLFEQLNGALIKQGLSASTVHAYLFGGCAVHLYTSSRISADVDIEFAYNLKDRDDVLSVLRNLAPVDFDSPMFGPIRLAIDTRFNTTLCPLHDSYQDRAEALELDLDSASPLVVWLPAAVDLAISKLGRLSPIDVDDILLLLAQPDTSWDQFETLAMEASQYYVGRDLAGTIAYIKWQWQNRRQ